MMYEGSGLLRMTTLSIEYNLVGKSVTIFGVGRLMKVRSTS